MMNKYFSKDNIYDYKINYYYDNNDQKYIIANNKNISITIEYKILGSYDLKTKEWLWGSDMLMLEKNYVYEKNELDIDEKFLGKKYFDIDETELKQIMKTLKNICIVADNRKDDFVVFFVVENILKITNNL